jgi:hypothetical protein
MGLVVAYSSPATPGVASWIEDLSGAVRLGTIDGLVDEAELGAVGISSILFDDPLGTLGHAGNTIVGLKQLHIDETACAPGDQRLWTGYIADRRFRRGTDSLITGVARKIDTTITDVNGFLSFRIFAPVAMDATSSFNRPAETDVVRVAALLTDVDFLSTRSIDDGLVSTGRAWRWMPATTPASIPPTCSMTARRQRAQSLGAVQRGDRALPALL